MAVKDQYFVALARSVFEGDFERAKSICLQAASKATNQRPRFAREIERIVSNRPGMVLLETRGRWEFRESSILLDDVILTKESKAAIRDLIREHNFREILLDHQLTPTNKILLEGPPGNGKTTLAAAIANALSIPMVRVAAFDVIASHVGESSSNLKNLFDEANRSPCVMFLDELDGLSMARGGGADAANKERASITTSLFVLIDALVPRTILICATNRPEDLDEALRRRFDLMVTIPAPTKVSTLEWLDRYRAKRWPEMPAHLVPTAKNFAELEYTTIRDHRRWVMEKIEKQSL